MPFPRITTDEYREFRHWGEDFAQFSRRRTKEQMQTRMAAVQQKRQAHRDEVDKILAKKVR